MTTTSRADPPADLHVGCHAELAQKNQELSDLRYQLTDAKNEAKDARKNTLVFCAVTALICFVIWLIFSSVLFKNMAHGQHARHNAENQARIYLRQIRFPFVGVYCQFASFGNNNHCRATTAAGAVLDVSCDDREPEGNTGCSL